MATSRRSPGAGDFPRRAPSRPGNPPICSFRTPRRRSRPAPLELHLKLLVIVRLELRGGDPFLQRGPRENPLAVGGRDGIERDAVSGKARAHRRIHRIGHGETGAEEIRAAFTTLGSARSRAENATSALLSLYSSPYLARGPDRWRPVPRGL